MHRFWGSVLKSALEILKPKEIIEIGSDRGQNSEHLLRWSVANDAKLHIIEPFPKNEVASWVEHYGDVFSFYRELSLEVLPKIGTGDVVFIDGDPNWYTVYHELMAISAYDGSFPLVFLHGVSWPYAKRDLYYKPENIPAKWRKDYAYGGVRPELKELSPENGFNTEMAHAKAEGESHSGVLTAVEDFMKEGDYELIILPVFHGLGILYHKSLLVDRPEIANWLQEIRPSHELLQLMAETESKRIEEMLARKAATCKLEAQQLFKRRLEIRLGHQSLAEVAAGYQPGGICHQFLIVQAYSYTEIWKGDYTYRIHQAGLNLEKDGAFCVRNVHIYHPDFYLWAELADLLILHLVANDEMYAVIQKRKAAGKITLYEMPDNLLALGDWIEAKSAYRHPVFRQNMFYYASICDGLQFSTHELAKSFGFLNPVHKVLENQIAHFQEPRPTGAHVVLGWGGSAGHFKDLAHYQEAISQFLAEHEQCSFYFMGPKDIYERLFAHLPRTRYFPNGSIADYYEFLAHLDIGLAPLSDSEFNRCRSDGKFVDYAAHGVVPMLSAAAPYRTHGVEGENALFFTDPNSLQEQLGQLVKDPKRIDALKRNAYEYARNQRSVAQDLEQRVAFLQIFLSTEPVAKQIPDYLVRDEVIEAMFEVYELQDCQRYDEALDKLDSLLAQFPNNHLAHYQKAKVLLELDREDEVAVSQIHPWLQSSLSSLLCLRALAHDKPWLPFFEKVEFPIQQLVLCPEYDDDPETRYQRILAYNPFHYQSLNQLGRIFSGKGDLQGARAQVMRICYMHPESKVRFEKGGYRVPEHPLGNPFLEVTWDRGILKKLSYPQDFSTESDRE